MVTLYRVANLGWVGFTLIWDFPPSCPPAHKLLLIFSAALAELGRGWNNTNQSQHNPGSQGDWPPCFVWHSLFGILHKFRTWKLSKSFSSLTTTFPVDIDTPVILVEETSKSPRATYHDQLYPSSRHTKLMSFMLIFELKL